MTDGSSLPALPTPRNSSSSSPSTSSSPSSSRPQSVLGVHPFPHSHNDTTFASDSDATESTSSSRAATLADTDVKHPHARSSPTPSVICFSDSSSVKTCVDDHRRYTSSSASSVTDVASTATDSASSGSSCHVERPLIPLPRLLFAHVGAALTLFLATTDATIVSTSLPTIVADFKTSQDNYPWVGIAYLLTQTAFQPLYGRFADLFGRKTILFTSIFIFMVGSLLCGLAPTFTSLCVFRAIAGIGGGGIVSSVWTITSELVEEKKRAKWSQALSVTWSASAVAGPLLGGLFSDGGSGHLSWRWAFLINLPIAAFAALILLLSLRNVNLRPANGITWNGLLHKFDFIGLFCFMSGTVGLVLGFSLSSVNGWSSPATLVPLLLGLTFMLSGVVYEMRTTREPLFPKSMFHSQTVGIISIISFLHQLAFNAGTFYLALYYQAVNGYTALVAGLCMLPYSLGSSIASIPAARFISYMQNKSGTNIGQKLVVITGLAISAIGFGILIVLDNQSSTVVQEIAPLFAGIGIGMLFHAPFQVLSMALDPDDIASATSAFFLVRFNGATCGLAVAGAVFNGRLLSSGETGALLSSATSSSIDLRALAQVQPIELRQEMLRIVTSAIQSIWIVCTPCLGFALLLALFLRTASTVNATNTKNRKCSTPPMITDEKSSSKA